MDVLYKVWEIKIKDLPTGIIDAEHQGQNKYLYIMVNPISKTWSAALRPYKVEKSESIPEPDIPLDKVFNNGSGHWEKVRRMIVADTLGTPDRVCHEEVWTKFVPPPPPRDPLDRFIDILE